MIKVVPKDRSAGDSRDGNNRTLRLGLSRCLAACCPVFIGPGSKTTTEQLCYSQIGKSIRSPDQICVSITTSAVSANLHLPFSIFNHYIPQSSVTFKVSVFINTNQVQRFVSSKHAVPESILSLKIIDNLSIYSPKQFV